jgi:hypothetical protein
MRSFALLLLSAVLCPATLYRIYVEERTDVLGGRSFGNAGPYERIVGRAHFRIDPSLPANKLIADIDKAPRAADGTVEFSADFYMLKPRDPALGNGTLVFDVVNRGNKVMLRFFNLGQASNDPQTEAALGDKFMLEQGFTLAWLGWQFDVPNTPGLMRLYAPRIPGMTGQVRAEFIPTQKTDYLPLAERNHQAYAVADTNSGSLTVRNTFDGVRTPIARSNWAYDGDSRIRVSGGLEPGRVYEFIYTARDPAVTGLSLAAVRDLISYLKLEGGPMLLGDQRRFLKRAIGVGTSQSGRFLRTFLYEGFNADEKGRKVFDGVWPHVAGAGRGSFNFAFAQPSRDAQPFGNLFYPTDRFPFTDTEQTDPETGRKDGLLTKAVQQKVVPKIFYTNGSYEYWGRAASLIHTQPPAPDTRIYFFTGAQHGPGRWPPGTDLAKHPANPLDYSYIMRALLMGMHSWLKDGTEPQASLYPSAKQLVPPELLKFPEIPGVKPPGRIHTAYRVDGSKEPPVVGTPFAAMAPAVDADGNETSGIRLPEVQHPLGTYTGWNYRRPGTGAPDEMIAFIGCFFAFPRSEADSGADPRIPIAQRYSGKAEYMAKIGAAARSLADRRYILERDVSTLEQRSSRMWDDLMSAQSTKK